MTTHHGLVTSYARFELVIKSKGYTRGLCHTSESSVRSESCKACIVG
jgi:hypothetical protein